MNLKAFVTAALLVLVRCNLHDGISVQRSASIDVRHTVTCMAFSPDGRVLTWGTEAGKFVAFDTQSNETLCEREPANEEITAICFADAGRIVVVGSRDNPNRVLVYDTARWNERAVRLGNVAVTQLRVLGDGKTVAVAELYAETDPEGGRRWTDSALRILNTETLAEHSRFRTWPDQPNCVAIAPNGKWIASIGERDRLWEVDDAGASCLGGPTELSDDSSVDGFAVAGFSHDGKLLALAGGHSLPKGRRDLSWGSLVLWDMDARQKSRAIAHSWYVEDADGRVEYRRVGARIDVITCLQFAPDDRLLATGCADSSVRFWNVASGEQVASVTAHKDGVTALAFAPDSRRIATAGDDGTIKIWELRGVPGRSR